jgi:N-acetylmuramoyl-L-alanine amidase
MRIIGHRLDPSTFEDTPNQGAEIEGRRWIVLHYTAGSSFESSLSWMLDRDSRVSAHVIVGRNAELTQIVRFDRQAWHAGRSHYGGVSGLNAWSIGIELDNPGLLHRTEGGRIVTSWGRVVKPGLVFTDELDRHWHTYTEQQIIRLAEVVSLIRQSYPEIEDVIGHSDIAPGRKQDPGPAFPWERFRTLCG